MRVARDPEPGIALDARHALELLRHIRQSKKSGTTTIAFVTQQWLGGRGLNRLLTEIHTEEMVFVGRVTPVQATDKSAKEALPEPGSGVLLGMLANPKEGATKLAAELRTSADKEQIRIQTITAASPRIAGYAKNAELPEAFAEVGVPVLWPVTPAEMVATEDIARVESLLELYLEIPKPSGGIGGGVGGGHEETDIEALTEAYGASGHEEAVRKAVIGRLPEWARNKTSTDAAGNLILHLGDETR